jgi:uncharacterized linocin/CFP29 family protein
MADERLTAAALEAMEQRAEAATPGPWEANKYNAVHEDFWNVDRSRGVPINWGEADCTFIAHAREDVPALVAECRRLYDDFHAAAHLADGNQMEIDDLRADNKRLQAIEAAARALVDAEDGYIAAGNSDDVAGLNAMSDRYAVARDEIRAALAR